MSLQNQPDDHLSPKKSDAREAEERYDTLIGVILAFGMAIGTWIYAVKPWQDSYLELSNEVETPPPVPLEQPIHSPIQGLENKITHHHEAPELAEASPLVNPFAAPTANLTPDPQTHAPIFVTVPELNKPIVVVLEPTAKNAAAPTSPVAPIAEQPIITPTITAAPVLPTAAPTLAPLPTTPVVTPIATPVATPAPIVTPAPTVAPPAVEPTPVITPPPAVTPEPVLPPNVMIRESIEFAMGKAAVPDSAKARLLEVAELLKKDTRQLKIVGHTDSIGFTGANRRLSLRRANAVKAFLVAAGVETSHLAVEGLGESQPIADNQTIEGRNRNRRIEIVL